MAVLKKKTRKAIRKSFRKAINKHAPIVAEHLATAIVAGIAAYLHARPKKGMKQIQKAAKAIPGGKAIYHAIEAAVPALTNGARSVTKKTKKRARKAKTAGGNFDDEGEVAGTASGNQHQGSGSKQKKHRAATPEHE